jgi:hypothetical protein
MMSEAQFDNISAGYVFVYDGTTGDVLWTHQRIVEVIRGQEERPKRITEAECERVRAEAAQVFRGRDVRAMIADEGFVLRDNTRIVVDPETKVLREIAGEPENIADHFQPNDKGTAEST